jgi:hypothetical protein
VARSSPLCNRSATSHSKPRLRVPLVEREQVGRIDAGQRSRFLSVRMASTKLVVCPRLGCIGGWVIPRPSEQSRDAYRSSTSVDCDRDKARAQVEHTEIKGR